MPLKKHNLLNVAPLSNFVVENGKGSYIKDKNGKKYLDINSGQFCSVLGHSNEILRPWRLSSLCN